MPPSPGPGPMLGDEATPRNRMERTSSVTSSNLTASRLSVADWGLDLILRWIKDAETRNDRISGLDAAIEAFEHNDEKEHDRELRTGIAEHLCGVIALALSPRPTDDDEEEENSDDNQSDNNTGMSEGNSEDDMTVEEEIAKTLSALEMVHRCSTTALQRSFDTIGLEILPLLLEVVEIALPVIHENDWWFFALCNAIKIIAYFSSLNNGHTTMGGHRAYLSTLMSILLCESTSHDDEINDLISEVLNILATYPRKMKLTRLYGLLVAVYAAALNDNSSDEVKESAAFLIMSMLETEGNRIIMLKDESGPLLDFLTKAMMDTRNTEQVNWTRCSAAKAAHMLCIPEVNATTLSSYEDGAFVEALVKLVLDGSESFSAACALCYLVGYKDSTRDDLTQTRPALLDILAKTALINPNATMAAEAVFKLLPVSSHDLFRRIVLLLSLRPNFCENTAVTAILERIGYSDGIRVALAEDECIIMILVKAARNKTRADVQSQATKALHLLSIDPASREKLLEDPDIVFSLASVIKNAKLDNSSKSNGSMFHEASANATCALCNLVIDDESNAEVYMALEKPKKPVKKKGLWICRCRRRACRKVENVFFSLCSDTDGVKM